MSGQITVRLSFRTLARRTLVCLGLLALAACGGVTLTGSSEGYAAVILYVVVYTAMNLAAFGAAASLTGAAGMEDVEDYRGIGYSRPFQGAVLALAMFALAGIPPTAGFIGKFFIFYAAFRGGEISLAVVGILAAAVSAYYYLRVVVNLYMHPAEAAEAHEASVTETVTLSAVSAVLLVIGVYPAPLLGLIDSILR